METDQDVLDAAMETDVRRAFEGNEDATVLVEDEDGNLVRLTVGEMFDDFASDARMVEEFRGCIA